jgi:hypothetical protein
MKIDNRPSLHIEETELEYLSSRIWIPGKASWQEMQLTYPDIDGEDGSALFFRWVSEQYKETAQAPQWRAELVCAILRMHDGCGEVLEQWYLDEAVITALDFGSPIYNSCMECELNVTIKYKEAEYVHPDPAKWLKPVTESFSSW